MDLDPIIYLKKYNVTGTEKANCQYLSQLLYSLIIQNFNVKLTDNENIIFGQYQQNVSNMISDLRELDEKEIFIVIDHLESIGYNYLIDCIFMWWCLPDRYSSYGKRLFNTKYKENIAKFNKKLTNNIEHKSIENFCIDCLSKTGKIPVHTIDLMWYYMNGIAIDLEFYNSGSCMTIELIVSENSSTGNSTGNTLSEYITFGFNMEFLLWVGLGRITYPTDIGKKKSFSQYLFQFITSPETLSTIQSSRTKNNYISQVQKICANPAEYFESQVLIPKEIIGQLSEL